MTIEKFSEYIFSSNLPPSALFERLAHYGDPSYIAFPIPMQQSNSANLSFVGLETFNKYTSYDKVP